jgi:hypothetical protein
MEVWNDKIGQFYNSSGELSGETSSREWIPEDGLYEHLVLKIL